MTPETVIWINARFLQRPVTGVERVARELLRELALRLDGQGRMAGPGGGSWRFRLLGPPDGPGESPWPSLPLVRAGLGGGHVWEQTSLPWLTRGGWLLSLCNTGPLFKHRQLLFFHDAQALARPENFTWTFRALYQLLYRIAGRSARILATNSRFSQRDLVSRAGLDPDKFVIIPLGADHVHRRPAVAPDEAGGSFLVAVSSPNPNKNSRAVQAALDLLGAQAPPCVWVGRRLERVFQAPGQDGGRIRFLGRVEDGELYGLYRAALALVYPSFYEGFGLPPVEAMALGCPVIVARAAALPEVCGDAALYCDPHDPATLAKAIRDLQADPALGETLRRQGLARAAHYTWARAADALVAALGRALGAGG
jgi:glycosyltransferase involved in cell wall biosynthesis